MNVLMVVAPQLFRDEELFEPRALLEAAGHTVSVASTRVGTCKGVRGGTVEATIPLDDVDVKAFAAVVFVGGPGARTLFDDLYAQFVAQEMHRAGKIVAAICVAPVILAHAGLLKGKRATVYPSENPALFAAHALVRALGVVVDGDLITASGPEHAHTFGQELVKALAGHGPGKRIQPAQHHPAAPH